MSDPIDTAVNLAKNNKSRLLETGKTAAISAASNIIANNSKLSKLKKLPTTKDPELLKQQAKAEAQKLIGEKQNELQQIKEKKIEELKDKASKLGPLLALGVGLFLKLPTFDPKLLATIAFLKAQKELRELKQKVSKENLKKAKENFTYPIKPPTPSPTPPPPPLPEAGGPSSVAPTPTPTPVTKPKTNYYIEIREQKNAWVAQVFLANPRSFQDTKSYLKSKYQTRQDAIDVITNDAKSSGLVGLPPEPGFTFPGTQT